MYLQPQRVLAFLTHLVLCKKFALSVARHPNTATQLRYNTLPRPLRQHHIQCWVTFWWSLIFSVFPLCTDLVSQWICRGCGHRKANGLCERHNENRHMGIDWNLLYFVVYKKHGQKHTGKTLRVSVNVCLNTWWGYKSWRNISRKNPGKFGREPVQLLLQVVQEDHISPSYIGLIFQHFQLITDSPCPTNTFMSRALRLIRSRMQMQGTGVTSYQYHFTTRKSSHQPHVLAIHLQSLWSGGGGGLTPLPATRLQRTDSS